MSNSNVRMLDLLVTLLTLEKMGQHLFSAILFLVEIPGFSKPDVGPVFQFSGEYMAVLNLIIFGLFLLGLYGKIRKFKWGSGFIVEIAAIDIVLEALFHGLYFLNESFIVSVVLIIVVFTFQQRYYGRIFI